MNSLTIFKTTFSRIRRCLPTGLKRKLVIPMLLLQSITAFPQVGVHTDFPDNSSAMDIVATDRGLLIPRVSLTTDLTNPSPVTDPAVGLLVFNSGADQPMGFYYWDGVHWVQIGSGSSSGDSWSLFGNSGTLPANNFLGTTDNQAFAIRTNSLERMRIMADGRIVAGATAPYHANDIFTVVGTASLDTAISAFTPNTGFYAKANSVGFYNTRGRYGVLTKVDSATGYAIYAKNYDPLGYGVMNIGANAAGAALANHISGLVATGGDGVFCWGKSANGTGIIAVGSNIDTAYSHPLGSGGAFAGYHGIFARARNASGTGVIGGGNNINPNALGAGSGGAFTGSTTGLAAWSTAATSTGVTGGGNNQGVTTISTGSGGAFIGYHGVFGKGVNGAGIGVIGLGSNGTNFATITNGCGGAFTGYYGAFGVGANPDYGVGLVGVGNNIAAPVLYPTGAGGSFTGLHAGAVGYGTDPTEGIGIIGSGNNVTPATLATGSGGAFTAINAGSFSKAVGAGGTGVIGVGNNIATTPTYAVGSGGAFTGTYAGTVGYGTDATTGTGVIGAGNNVAPVLLSPNVGCGGSFTGLTYGVYGFATNSGNVKRGGGYFACNPTSSGAYAYVGYRNNNQNYKTLGNGTNSTIVKNTKGDLIVLFCPEAPEVVFQDFGIGQLVDGKAHITIDPDLAVNINVSEDHPLKVYITPEGDCNGVYVANKSANGFDVIELMKGRSNAQFSWQIVATRANEKNLLKDGSVEFTVYDNRFPPAPGPLEISEQPAQTRDPAGNSTFKQIESKSEKGIIQFSEPVTEKSVNATETTPIETIKDPGE